VTPSPLAGPPAVDVANGEGGPRVDTTTLQPRAHPRAGKEVWAGEGVGRHARASHALAP
jgi:hypothetical protein